MALISLILPFKLDLALSYPHTSSRDASTLAAYSGTNAPSDFVIYLTALVNRFTH